MYDGVIELIYGAVTEPETWPVAMRALCQAFGAHSGTLAFTHDSKTVSELGVSHGVFEDEPVRNAYMSYYGALDPAVRLFAELSPGRFVTTSKAWSPRQLARQEFYNDFYRKLGLADSIGVNLIRDRHSTALVTVQRASPSRPYSQKEAREFVRVSQHLRRALQLRRQFDLQARASSVLDDALTRLAVGIVLLDSTGRILHWNGVAQEIAESRDGLVLTSGGCLEVVDRTTSARFAELCGPLQRGDRAGKGGQLLLPRPSGKRPLSVLVASPPPGLVSDGARRAAVLLLIRDPERLEVPDLATAMSPFRLTPAELDLLADLAAGRTLQEHCERRWVTVNTGKFHLKSLFSKTGARGQADLIRMALTISGDR